jgi:hypothetical protein
MIYAKKFANMTFWKKDYCSLVLWMSNTAPRNPMVIVAGRKIEGNSGTGLPSFFNMKCNFAICSENIVTCSVSGVV